MTGMYRAALVLGVLAVIVQIPLNFAAKLPPGNTGEKEKTDGAVSVLRIAVSVDNSNQAQLEHRENVSRTLALDENHGLELYHQCGLRGNRPCNLLYEYCDVIAGAFGTCQSCADACDPRRTRSSQHAKQSCELYCKVYTWHNKRLEEQHEKKDNAATTLVSPDSLASKTDSGVSTSQCDFNTIGISALMFAVAAVIIYSTMITVALVIVSRRRITVSRGQRPTNLELNLKHDCGLNQLELGEAGCKPPASVTRRTSPIVTKRQESTASISSRDGQTSWEERNIASPMSTENITCPSSCRNDRINQPSSVRAGHEVNQPSSAQSGHELNQPAGHELDSEQIPVTVESFREPEIQRETTADVHTSTSVPSGRRFREDSFAQEATGSDEPLLGSSSSYAPSSTSSPSDDTFTKAIV